MGGQEASPQQGYKLLRGHVILQSEKQTNKITTNKNSSTPVFQTDNQASKYMQAMSSHSLQAEGGSQQRYHATKIAPGFLSAPIQEPSVEAEVFTLHFIPIPLFFLFYLQ